MFLSVGGSFACFARNACCTVTTELLMWYSNTQIYFSPGAAIFSLHTLASPSGRNVNYVEKLLTGGKKLSCSFFLYRFRKYVSYGFPIINFLIPSTLWSVLCMCVYMCLCLCILNYLPTLWVSCTIPNTIVGRGKRSLSSLKPPGLPWGHPNKGSYSVVNGDCFHDGEAAGAWCWLRTFI